MRNGLPRIGVTCSIDRLDLVTGRCSQRLRLNLPYLDAVLATGGLPIPLAPVQDEDLVARQLDQVDALLVTGGPDVPPSRYGQPPHPKTVPLCGRRTNYDFAAFTEADKRGLPILGICLGHQIINVARGGSLIQHIEDLPRTPPLQHTDAADYIRHTVRTEPDTLLRRIVPKATIEANSSHHQAVDRVGEHLVATAWAPDGIIEAIEDPRRPFLLGVQWHPEMITHLQDHAALFAALAEAARRS